ncbi:hypothetical protein SAMN05519103_07778 [Rhizobiales bacterium GAS113]|nr:hypothetical protein SAMN05519103_07778 [Rhizobiales bacterium GAS113]
MRTPSPRTIRTLIHASALALAASPALAAEPSGCDKFAWPLQKEQQALGEAKAAPADAELDRNAGKALTLALRPLQDAKLPLAPERAPKKTPPLAGFLRFAGGPAAGLYKVSLSEGAWIDLVQDGKRLKPTAFTGATDCPNIRKSVKFEIGPAPFILEVSDAPSDHIGVVLTPAE